MAHWVTKVTLMCLLATCVLSNKPRRRQNRGSILPVPYYQAQQPAGILGGLITKTIPVIVTAPVSQVAVESTILALTCEATGSPKPRISWERNEKEVSKNRFEISHYTEKDRVGSVLWVEQIKSRKGTPIDFTCVASNQLGQISAAARIEIVTDERKPRGFPFISIPPSIRSVAKGEDAALICSATGTPPPTIYWYKDFKRLPIDGKHVSLTPTGTINIRECNYTDHGKYHCAAENSHGVSISKPATLYVRDRPHPTTKRSFPPKFSISPYRQYDVPVGQGVNVTCVAVGGPMPKVKWQKETKNGPVDVVPEDGPSEAVGKLVLQLKNVRESANYTCVGTSSIDTIKFTTFIRVRSFPKPPIALEQADVPTTSTALISWKKGSSDPVTSYTVYYKEQSKPDQPYFIVDGVGSTRYLLVDLKPYTWYEVRVSGTNDLGEGQKCEALSIQTAEKEPTSPPESINAYLQSVSSIVVVWEPPLEPNGAISAYRIYHTSDVTLPLEEWMENEAAGNERGTVIHGLVTDTTYTICVSAVNYQGEGPLTKRITVKTTKGVPPQPRNIEGESESPDRITLKWERPQVGQGPGGDTQPDITTYLLAYNCSAHGCETRMKKLTIPPKESFTLTNLKPNTVYDIKLAAQNIHGLGSFTQPLSIKTREDEPSAPPLKVTGRAIDSQRIAVTWVPPAKENHNGALTGYIIYYYPNPQQKGAISHTLSEEPSQKAVRVNSDGSIAVINQLTPYTEYIIWMTVSNSVGEGPSSPKIRVVTHESTPSGPPRHVTAESINSTSIYLKWGPPGSKQRNGEITGYEITYGSSDKNGQNVGNVKNVQVRLGALTELKESEARTVAHMITDLEMDMYYSIQIAGATSKGPGEKSDPLIVKTRGAAPSKPKLSVTKSDGKTKLSWAPPDTPNGKLINYVLNYGRKETQNGKVLGWETLKFSADARTRYYYPTKVYPGWSYEFRMAAENEEGVGTEDIAQLTLASQKPADGPRNLTAVPACTKLKPLASGELPLAFMITWDPLSLDRSNGKVTQYALYWNNEATVETVSSTEYERILISDGKTSYLFDDLRPEEKYTFKIAAINSAGEGPQSPALIAEVKEGERIHVDNLKNLAIIEISSSAVWLQWELPKTFTDNMRYMVKYESLVRSRALPGVHKIRDASTLKAHITGLKPDTPYNFTIVPDMIEASTSQVASVTAQTVTPDLPVSPRISDVTSNGTVQILLTRATAFRKVKKYQLVIVPLIKSPTGEMVAPMKPDEIGMSVLRLNSLTMRRRRRKREVSDSRPYITAEFPTLSQLLFTIGDGLNVGGYINKPLEKGKSYKAFLRVQMTAPVRSFTTSDYSSTFTVPAGKAQDTDEPVSDSTSKPTETAEVVTASLFDQLWIIGPIAGGILIILIVVLFILLRRKKSKSPQQPVKYTAPISKQVTSHVDPVEMRRMNCQTPGMINHPPISITEFEAHIERLKANDNLKFSQEYDSIDPGQAFTWDHSNMEVNKPKNRYANVIAYDHSRVILSPIDGVPGSDYINANYHSGYRRQNAYIATQGPTVDTAGDFWRMVWEQRSSSVVMMTKCEERGKVKCDQYWPATGSETYGLMQVTLLDEIELATYCIRCFALHKNGLSERREVRHFQFTAWPDHGVPEHATPVLNFMRRVKASNPADAGPVVVHCSAGVGRAGCFICIDVVLERIKNEKVVDVYGQVTCMRAERNYMVQTEDQYIFIHDALMEAISCGNTELPARNLYAHLHKLTNTDTGENVTGMELEFKRLASHKSPSSRFVSANMPCNKFKNRLVNILPYEGTRVCLQPIRGVEGSDYINASFIDGYRDRQAYVATQGPLPETTEDFWRMLWEHNSTIVVMLTKLREMGRDKCHQYWPAERSARYQYFVVDPMSEYSMHQYILREFKVTDARDGQSRTVRQFQFTDWPEQGVPKSGEGFIDFIGQVHKTKEQFGQEGPITIHCSAGVGRTGVFITLSIALERMRYEGVVDMFQTVKMLRTQRPAMVQTEDQYQFCYRAALEYLGSFDHYSTNP
ncbi:receptor-type tyrosine-protein phosphatase delta-like isoform X3 [Styela clava]